MQPTRNYRPLIVLMVVVVLAVGIIALVSKLVQPHVVLTIVKPYNPVENTVTIGKNKVYPTGEGGLVFTEKTGAGDQTITISGPFIVTKQLTAQTSYFDKTAVSANVEARTLADIFLSVTGRQASPTSVRMFDNNLIIGTAGTPATGDNENPVVVLYYSNTTRTWLDKTTTFLGDITKINPSTNARDYYDELSED